MKRNILVSLLALAVIMVALSLSASTGYAEGPTLGSPESGGPFGDRGVPGVGVKSPADLAGMKAPSINAAALKKEFKAKRQALAAEAKQKGIKVKKVSKAAFNAGVALEKSLSDAQRATFNKRFARQEKSLAKLAAPALEALKSNERPTNAASVAELSSMAKQLARWQARLDKKLERGLNADQVALYRASRPTAPARHLSAADLSALALKAIAGAPSAVASYSDAYYAYYYGYYARYYGYYGYLYAYYGYYYTSGCSSTSNTYAYYGYYYQYYAYRYEGYAYTYETYSYAYYPNSTYAYYAYYYAYYAYIYGYNGYYYSYLAYYYCSSSTYRYYAYYYGYYAYRYAYYAYIYASRAYSGI